jgi:hypothetical protein
VFANIHAILCCKHSKRGKKNYVSRSEAMSCHKLYEVSVLSVQVILRFAFLGLSVHESKCSVEYEENIGSVYYYY